MAGNGKLNSAAQAKKDKFKTRLEDIENELHHYREFFKGKSVLCNCDDPFESNFFQYFALKFNDLELKKLVTTSYIGSPIAGSEVSLFDPKQTAYMTEVTELKDWNGDGREDLNDVKFAIENKIYPTRQLEGTGDFQSEECVELLKACDVVTTNPPFSLFREYVRQLVDSGKKFIILGNKNAVTYKEIFPLIMANKIWTGFSSWSGGMWFASAHEDYYDKIVDGVPMKNVPSIWFTNIETPKRYWDIPLFKSYRDEPERYPHYDNYDAINVDKTSQIPVDYDGVMGVPITFLEKYNPTQFEILGCTESEGVGFSHGLWHDDSKFKQATINGEKVYKRLFIRRKQN